MTLMLVIADDLTGAADCGVAFAGQGLRTMVVLGDADGEMSANALAVDGDTRRLPPNEAASKTARLLSTYIRHQDTLVYKKLDSTLRGNVGEELAATLEARRTLAGKDERVVLVLAPAFPGTGRTTLGGRQMVNGLALEESGLFKDDRASVQSDIASTLRKAHLSPGLVTLDLVRNGSEVLSAAMLTMAQQVDVMVCDAETDDDMRRIAEASMVLGRKTVWAGSAGLAWHLPAAAGLTRAPANGQAEQLATGPTLFVIGSGSAVSRQQAEVLASKSDTIVMRIPHDVLMGGEESQRLLGYGLELKGALNAGCDVAILPDPVAQLDPSLGPLLTTALATLVRPLAQCVGALVATGGETARAVFDAWGVRRLRLIGEVEAGLPFSVTSGWSRELPVLTKAGGFGKPDSLLRCLQFLHALDRGDAAHSEMSKEPNG